ncbi:MAG: hypothetical protein WD049_01855 [Candidatus Paceibacterota bacterium]
MSTSNAQAGQTVFAATIFFLIISLLIILGIAGPIMRHLSATIETRDSKTSYYAAESLQEDIVYRLMNGMNVGSTEELSLDGSSATAIVTDVANGKSVRTTGDVGGIARNVETVVVLGDGVSFSVGVQSDAGGLTLENSASVRGNVFANGSVVGTDNMIYGSVISAGPDGLIENVHATGSAYAHTIKDAWVEKDAYYFSDSTISNTTVEGTRYPDSDDQATTSLPISDALIEKWKDAAMEGGINDCGGNSVYEIKNTDATIGPEKFECDLTIQGTNMTVEIAGPIWVEGDLKIRNSPTIQVHSSLGSKSVAVVVDDPSNRTTGSLIDLDNSAEFIGGDGSSHIMFISQNNDAENGGSNPAIEIANSLNGDVMAYAAHGLVFINNSIEVTQVTAYRIHARNSAEIIYKSGIASLLFDSGPSASFSISSWNEVE